MRTNKMWLQLIFIFFASVLLAFAYNTFLLPHKVLSGGITGVAMIISLHSPFNAGMINLILNLPILFIGYQKLGRKFIGYTIFSVFVSNMAMIYIPIKAIAEDALLSSVFGGVLVGIACGLILRSSGSSGGLDVVSLLITRKYDYPIGTISLALNGVVIFVSGFLFDWQLALYTMVSIYASSKTVDSIHTRHIKLTLMIVTSKGEEVREALLSHLQRGITILEGEGAFTHQKREVLYMVITRYELSDIKHLIMDVDKCAFVNVTETVEIMGRFRKA